MTFNLFTSFIHSTSSPSQYTRTERIIWNLTITERRPGRAVSREVPVTVGNVRTRGVVPNITRHEFRRKTRNVPLLLNCQHGMNRIFDLERTTVPMPGVK